jgi:hypothetical protein
MALVAKLRHGLMQREFLVGCVGVVAVGTFLLYRGMHVPFAEVTHLILVALKAVVRLFRR